VTENFIVLDNLDQYSEYCFVIDSYPEDTAGGYWSESVEYCATTGVRGTVYDCIFRPV